MGRKYTIEATFLKGFFISKNVTLDCSDLNQDKLTPCQILVNFDRKDNPVRMTLYLRRIGVLESIHFFRFSNPFEFRKQV